MSWREQAACKGRPVEPFFQNSPPRWVRALCDGCPVAAPCLLDAIDTDAEGYRAGTSTTDRLRVRMRSRYRVNRRRAS